MKFFDKIFVYFAFPSSLSRKYVYSERPEDKWLYDADDADGNVATIKNYKDIEECFKDRHAEMGYKSIFHKISKGRCKMVLHEISSDRNNPPKGTILLFFGNGFPASVLYKEAEDFVKKGFQCICVNYPGYMHKGGEYGTGVGYKELQMMPPMIVDFITKNPKFQNNLNLYGFSIGGCIASATAHELQKRNLSISELHIDSSLFNVATALSSFLPTILKPFARFLISDTLLSNNHNILALDTINTKICIKAAPNDKMVKPVHFEKLKKTLSDKANVVFKIKEVGESDAHDPQIDASMFSLDLSEKIEKRETEKNKTQADINTGIELEDIIFEPRETFEYREKIEKIEKESTETEKDFSNINKI